MATGDKFKVVMQSDIEQTPSDSTTKVVSSSVVKNGLNSKAPLASPEFTGTPTAPTATTSTNTTQVATTAFVQKNITRIKDTLVPTENNDTVSRDYSAGEYFYWKTNKEIYRTLRAIDEGDSIIVSGAGQNCEETTIGDELAGLADAADANIGNLISSSIELSGTARYAHSEGAYFLKLSHTVIGKNVFVLCRALGNIQYGDALTANTNYVTVEIAGEIKAIKDSPVVRFYQRSQVFPAEGEADVIYVSRTNNTLYHWSAGEYVKLADYDDSISDLYSTISAINSGEISPFVETTDTASRAYSVGRYFIRQTGSTYELCIARTAIAQGDTLNGAAGGNYLTSTVTEEIETVNAWLDDIQSDVDNKLDPLYTPKTLAGPVVTFDDGLDGALLGGLSVAIEPVQASGTPTPENPLPIFGWSGANVIRCGKNLANSDNLLTRQGWAKDSQGVYSGNVNKIMAFSKTLNVTQFKSNTRYKIAFNRKNESSILYIYLNYSDNTRDERTIGKQSSLTPFSYVSAAEKTLESVTLSYSTAGTIYLSDIDISEYGESSEYEPYGGETLSIPFGQTVYGGTLDVVSGKLTVDSVIKSLNGTESFSYIANTYISLPAEGGKNWNKPTYSSHFRCADSGDPPYLTGSNSTSVKWLRIDNSVAPYDTIDHFKAFLASQYNAGTPVQYVYKLATPQVYYLTPNEVQTLLGLNNIYADCGNVSVTYRGDVLNLYCKVADTKNDLSAFMANIAPVDDSPTASAPIQPYQLMMHNGRLYKTTRAIATDEMYVVAESMNDANGNIIPTSLGAEINIINAHLND